MRKFWNACLLINSLCFLVSVARADTREMDEQSVFTRGENTNHLPDRLGEGFVQKSENMRYAKNLGATKRLSLYTELVCSTAGSAGFGTYFDANNNEWFVRVDTLGVLTATKSTSCAEITLLRNVSTVERTRFASGLGRLWFTNKQDGLKWTDIVSLTTVTAAGLAGDVEIFRNRVVLGDIATELSSIRLSGESNGEDWNVDSRFSTSPVTFSIGGVNDGNRVFWIIPGSDELVIGKRTGIFTLTGFDQVDFKVRLISSQVGSTESDSPSSRGLEVLFISNRGLESYTPPDQINRVSEPVQNLIDPISGAGINSRNLTFTSGHDWSAWASVPAGNISTSTVVGSVQVEAQNFTDTADADFSQGSTQGGGSGGTVVIGNGIEPAASGNGRFISRTFGTLASSPTWTSFAAETSQFLLTSTVAFYVDRSTASNEALDTPNPISDTKTYWGNTIPPLLIDGNYSGTEQKETDRSSSATYRVQVSSGSRYARYRVDFTAPISTGTPRGRVESVTLQMIATGYIQSPTLDFSSNISSFGILSVDYAFNGGSITFQIQTSADGNFSGNWSSQTANQQITVTPQRYGLVRLVFDSSATVSVPIVNALTINWFEGQGRPLPLGVVQKNDYYLFYSTSIGATATNDKGLVLDKNQAFTEDSGIYINAATVYNKKLYVGDIRDGNVYSVEQSSGGTDGGANTESSITFRRFDFKDPDRVKQLQYFYLTISREGTAVSHIFKVEYFLDGGTVAYRAENVELSTGTRLGVLKSNIPIELPRQCYYVDVQVSEISQSTPVYTIHRFRVYADMSDAPQ